MDEQIMSNATPHSNAEYEADFEQMLVEMKHLNELMKRDQAVIDRLASESQTLKAETRAILASMGAPV